MRNKEAAKLNECIENAKVTFEKKKELKIKELELELEQRINHMGSSHVKANEISEEMYENGIDIITRIFYKS